MPDPGLDFRARAESGMRWLIPGTIRSMLLLLLVVVLIPVLLVQAGIHYSRFQERRAQEFESNLELARAVGAAFDAHIDDILRQDLSIGTALTSSPPPSDQQTNRLLTQVARAYPTARYFSWVDPWGMVVASSFPDVVGIDISDRSYFQAISGGREWVVSDLLLARVTGEPTFAVARGIRDDKGTLQGIMVALVNTERLGDVLNVQRAGRAAIAVIDSRGWGVYRYPEVPLTWEQRDWSNSPPAMRQALAGAEVTGSFVSPVDGQMRMSGVAPIRSIGWAAGASVPESQAIAPVIQDLLRDFVLLVLVAVASFLIALAIGRQITIPMSHLREHASAIGRGELGRSVKAAGPAELNELASAFNRMAEELQLHETQRERLLGEVQHRAAELEAVVTNTDARLALLDRDSNFVMVNSAYAEGSGHVGDDLIGRNHFALFPNPENQAIFELVRDTGEPYRAVEKPFQYVNQPGREETYWNWTLVPIKDKTGSVEGLLFSLLDVTPQVRARRRVEELAEESRRRAAELEDLLRTISHDLRTPLTAIHGHAQLLLRALEMGRLGDREKKSAEAVVTGARRMNAMIEDLVESARLESGQLTLNRAPLDLRSFVLGLTERLAGGLEAERIRAELPDSLPPVLADPNRLERILANLLGNALKYSPSESEVLVRAEETYQGITVSVADRGTGIATEDLPHLFERFYRTIGARRTEGLGLGLYITRMLVEAHEGRLWVESTLGQGSTFYFTMPVVADLHPGVE